MAGGLPVGCRRPALAAGCVGFCCVGTLLPADGLAYRGRDFVLRAGHLVFLQNTRPTWCGPGWCGHRGGAALQAVILPDGGGICRLFAGAGFSSLRPASECMGYRQAGVGDGRFPFLSGTFRDLHVHPRAALQLRPDDRQSGIGRPGAAARVAGLFPDQTCACRRYGTAAGALWLAVAETGTACTGHGAVAPLVVAADG